MLSVVSMCSFGEESLISFFVFIYVFLLSLKDTGSSSISLWLLLLCRTWQTLEAGPAVIITHPHFLVCSHYSVFSGTSVDCISSFIWCRGPAGKEQWQGTTLSRHYLHVITLQGRRVCMCVVKKVWVVLFILSTHRFRLCFVSIVLVGDRVGTAFCCGRLGCSAELDPRGQTSPITKGNL